MPGSGSAAGFRGRRGVGHLCEIADPNPMLVNVVYLGKRLFNGIWTWVFRTGDVSKVMI